MKIQKDRILDFFKDLSFDERNHLYKVNNTKINSSVSKIIKNFVDPFDSYKVSLRVSKNTNVSQKELLKKWKKEKDQACNKGKNVHLFGEHYPFDKNLKAKDNLEKAIVKFWNDLPRTVVPVMTELKMYHKKYLFAGTADILLYNTITKKFIIADYKTNKDLFKNYKNKKMLGLFNNLLDCPYNKYQLQLSFYQILLEQVGLEVSSRKLIWLTPTSNYKLYSTDNYTSLLKDYLKYNKV